MVAASSCTVFMQVKITYEEAQLLDVSMSSLMLDGYYFRNGMWIH
jgi:hypothetical protein